MLYIDYLKTVTECPFCNLKNQIVKENATAFLTYAVAPYSKHHLLVIPKRHLKSFLELTREETMDIEELLRYGAELLRVLKDTDYSILVRTGEDVGKSVAHLHYHIIPKIEIGSQTYGGGDRKVLTDDEVKGLMHEFKTAQDSL